MIFHFGHALGAVGCHIDWVWLLINLHNLSLLLDRSVWSAVEATLHVSADWIGVRIHSLVLLAPTLNVNRLIQRHLLRALVLMRLMSFLKLRFNLRNALHPSTCWQDYRSTLPRYFLSFASNLLRPLKPFFTLRILLAVENKASTLSWNLGGVVQGPDRVISGTFKLILIHDAILLGCLSGTLFVVFKVLCVFVAAFRRQLPSIVGHVHEWLRVRTDSGLVF